VPLTDPFAAYNARDVFEAQRVCELINNEGIEAHVVEDNSMVGVSGLGLMPELHKPQVWIERANADRVKPILDDYEQREKTRRERGTEAPDDVWAGRIQVVCDECEQTLSFPVAQKGTVEICPQCGRYVDVEDSEEEEDEEWWLAGSDDEEPPS
jgi:hypothetical protein